MVTPVSKRRAASVMKEDFRRSERRACFLAGLARSTRRYRSTRPPDDELRVKLRELAYRRPRFGYRRLGIFLRREGIRINDKKVLRLYRQEGLVLPRKRPRKRLFRRPRPLVAVVRPLQRWTMDFEMDFLASGRRFRTLNVVDEYTRQCHAILVDTSISGRRSARLLDEIGEKVGLPETIVVDNGTEFTSRAFLSWATERKVELHFIDPGKPTQNCFVESFNGKFRDECLNGQWFTSLEDARREIEIWRVDYNDVRPHSSLGKKTPAEFAAAHEGTAA